MTRTDIETVHDLHQSFLQTQARALVPLSPAELVARALHLANSCSPQEIIEGEFALIGSHGLAGEKVSEYAKRHGNPDALAWWEKHKQDREAFRAALELCIKSPRAARERFETEIIRGMARVAIVPQLAWHDGAINTQLSFYPLDLSAWRAFVLANVLARDSEIGRALRICKLCDRVFLSYPPPGGGPRPAYCSLDRGVAVRLNSRDRQRRLRERQARKAK